MEFIINCPHCDTCIVVEKLNCAIFRCGVIKKNMKRLPPHSSKEKCDKLYKDGLIYGCGKPFRIDKKTKQVSICDYI